MKTCFFSAKLLNIRDNYVNNGNESFFEYHLVQNENVLKLFREKFPILDISTQAQGIMSSFETNYDFSFIYTLVSCECHSFKNIKISDWIIISDQALKVGIEWEEEK